MIENRKGAPALESQDLKKRFQELSEKSYYENSFTFTNFLSASDAALVFDVVKKEDFTLWGGAEESERVVIRFGSVRDMGYEVPFPIRIIRIAPVNVKFSDDLSHRDFLGALMNLGIERDLLGDIVVRENHAYLFALEHMAPFIMENLDRVKHTSVTCEVLEEALEDIKPVLEEEDLIVSNIRIDAILSKLYHLARGTAQEMVREGRVLVNGRQIMSTSFEPKDGDVLVLRGYGKAKYVGKSGDTRKGKQVVKVMKYV